MTAEERAELVAKGATGPIRVTRYACDDLEAGIAAAIRGAVAAERDRAAKVAEDYSAGYEAVRAAEGQSWCPKCGEYTRDVADAIAARIREGG